MLEGQESRTVEIKVVEAAPAANNTYPLEATFDAARDGKVTHREDLHVNVIAWRAVSVDGDLKEWDGILPQIVTATGAVGHNLTEKAWLPTFTFEGTAASGVTTAYLAYDHRNFYFAAKMADNTPWPGGVCYATRDDDQYFFPLKSYVVHRDGSGTRREELVWPLDVRRYSYRKEPDLPSGSRTDNVQLGFGVFEPGRNGTYACPPGTMPRFTAWQCTDYEYAFNPVAESCGGGAEMWRLIAPGVPRKHFYPRQPKAEPDGGPVSDGRLVMARSGNTRIVEAAIPWSELGDVRRRADAGETVRFTFRVNDNEGPAYELNANRSVSQLNTYALHNYGEEHWSTETEFAFEKQ
jgi:hypothetical protein